MNRASIVKSAIAFTLLGAVGGGCAMHGEIAIPPSATLLSSGQNGLITATPNVAGTVYVYDSTGDKMLYSGPVQSGDKIVVDPGASMITINAVTVGEPQLFSNHEYMIKFDHP